MSAAIQKVTLQYEGKAYTVEVADSDTLNTENETNSVERSEENDEKVLQVSTDESPASQVMCEINEDVGVNNDTPMDQSEPKNAVTTLLLQASSVNGNCSKDDVRWSRELTLLLITERGKREEFFETSTVKKSKLWDLIAKKINHFSPVTYTGTCCCDKWRSLLQRYRMIKSKLRDPRHRPVTWNYYDAIDAFMGNKAFIQPRTKKPLLHTLKPVLECSSNHRGKLETSKSLKPTVPVPEEHRVETDFHVGTSGFAGSHKDFLYRFGSLDQTKKQKVEDEPLWLKKYLRHKTGEEERRIIREERQLDEQSRRWREKKELEERKIAVMTELNKSIKLLLDKLK